MKEPSGQNIQVTQPAVEASGNNNLNVFSLYLLHCCCFGGVDISQFVLFSDPNPSVGWGSLQDVLKLEPNCIMTNTFLKKKKMDKSP